MKTSRFLGVAILTCGLASVVPGGGARFGPQPAAAGLQTTAGPPATIRFRQDGVCQLPILTRATTFKGGATTGEEISVSLDTRRNLYEIRIDASKTPGRQGMRRTGSLVLDRDDCTYRLPAEASAQLTVNKYGILFGGVDAGIPEQAAPALIVAFKDTSSDLASLSGSWWVFEGGNNADLSLARQAGTAYEVRILPDGRFSNCELQGSAGSQCGAPLGRIFFNGKVFISQDEHGNAATLVVGLAAGKLVPILLQQGDPEAGIREAGMRFLAPHEPAPRSWSPSRQHLLPVSLRASRRWRPSDPAPGG